jgi:MerR family transcriptional regulator, redox-sensitive transcriptional activator SoxR
MEALLPAVDLLAKPIAVNSRIQVKVNLKSREKCCYFVDMSPLLTISEVAHRSGVAASALRFYEEKGLIDSERARSGHRRYPRAVLRRVAFIVFAQRIGMTLDEVAAELAKLPEGRVPTGADWAKLSGAWRHRIDDRIGELERLRAGLTECIGCGCLSLDRCRLANPEDRAARLGPGPRYWVSDRRRSN